MSPCCNKGPGYASPKDAFENGTREKLVYIPCIVPEQDRPDYLVTVDVDDSSPTFSQVIHRLKMPNIGDEIHHSGWNACSSCHDDSSRSRNRLVLPSIGSSRIYFVDTATDPKAPSIDKIVEPEEIKKLDCSHPHTAHCLADGDIMISTMGDGSGDLANQKGDFILIDGKDFKVKGTYGDDKLKYGYDFWYQPYHNVMISTEFGAPSSFLKRFDPSHVAEYYGRNLNVFDWKERKLVNTIDLGDEGALPLEIRFLHDPKASTGFVGCALYAKIFRIFKGENGEWKAEKVIDVAPKTVEGWALPQMPGVLTDILISMDDKYLYFSNWIQGDIRQYDISNPAKPKLTGQVFLGGSFQSDNESVKVTEDPENAGRPDPVYVKGVRIQGGPQMIQLSLDGKRLYVTNSLLSPWDKQFYPEMAKKGSQLVRLNVDRENGGMTLDETFLVDFGQEPEGPVFAHEVRYPGGDCSSDIYLAQD